MKIAVTSDNKLKVDAVRKAYFILNPDVEVIGHATNSNVGEQPINQQTLVGARNRISDLTSRIKYFDKIVSIENGIFREGDRWLDKAVIIIYDVHTKKENIGYSDSVVFPDEYVERARQIGFDKITVSQVMEEAGYVKNRKDPHLSISGISRQVYLEEALKKLIQELEK